MESHRITKLTDKPLSHAVYFLLFASGELASEYMSSRARDLFINPSGVYEQVMKSADEQTGA